MSAVGAGMWSAEQTRRIGSKLYCLLCQVHLSCSHQCGVVKLFQGYIHYIPCVSFFVLSSILIGRGFRDHCCSVAYGHY